MSILNVEVSCFKNYFTPGSPKSINLLTWLRSKKYSEQTKLIRRTINKEKRDKLKCTLPAITPSGIFSYKSNQSLIRHSGLIQFDIDRKDNLHIENFGSLKEELSKIINIAYCGYSVSGLGYWGLIPIEDPNHHIDYYRKMISLFATYGIVLDEKTQSLSSLRGYSFDPEAYYNHMAIPLSMNMLTNNGKKEIKGDKKGRKKLKTYHQDFSSSGCEDKWTKINIIYKDILTMRIDITGNYDQWFSIGCALANELGESGREIFHGISQFHEKYNVLRCDKQFDNCLTNRYKYPFSLATVIYYYKICK